MKPYNNTVNKMLIEFNFFVDWKLSASIFAKASLTVVSNSQCEWWFSTINDKDQHICTLGTFKYTTTDFCHEVIDFVVTLMKMKIKVEY